MQALKVRLRARLPCHKFAQHAQHTVKPAIHTRSLCRGSAMFASLSSPALSLINSRMLTPTPMNRLLTPSPMNRLLTPSPINRLLTPSSICAAAPPRVAPARLEASPWRDGTPSPICNHHKRWV
jgi:hypothetical protein